MSFGKVAHWFFGLLLLIDLFSHLKHLICKTLESITVPGLVLSLVIENADLIQEAFVFTQAGSVLFVVPWSLYVFHGVVHLPLLVMALG
jgi:hypothetical protein